LMVVAKTQPPALRSSALAMGQLLELPYFNIKLTERNYQLYYDLKLIILACLSGVLTSLAVNRCRLAISTIDNLRIRFPVLSPILGSCIIGV
jgi:hypothetical protein